MLVSRSELVPDDMADILYPISTSGPLDMAAWPNTYEPAEGHESAWRYQGHSPYGAPEDMSQSNMHEQAWSTYSVSPGLGSFPHLQSSPDLVNASHQLSGNEVMSFEQVPQSTDSSNPLHDHYQTTRFFSPRDTISSDTRPPHSSNTSAALASAAALRKREQSLYSPLDGIDTARQRPYQAAQSVPRQHDQRSASLKVPSTTAQQGIGRATRSNSTSSIQLQDEERLLIHLKEEESLTWKEIAQRFQSDLGISYQIPALQMRYKRLKEKIRIWSKGDLEALRQARDYWETKKWEIISNKMLEFGASEKFSVEACKRKLNELESGAFGGSMIAADTAQEAAAPYRIASSGAASGQVLALAHERSQTDPQQWLLPQWQS